jgi:hypothetical protein
MKIPGLRYQRVFKPLKQSAMKEYLLFIALLMVIYMGYLYVQRKEKKAIKRYYGYRTSRHAQQTRKAA